MNNSPDKATSELATRAANGQLQPGARLNPNGRPRGSYSGIRRTFETLFQFMAEPEIQARIRDALREEAKKNPARFARQFILPVTPHKFRKEIRARIRAAEVASPFSTHSETDKP